MNAHESKWSVTNSHASSSITTNPSESKWILTNSHAFLCILMNPTNPCKSKRILRNSHGSPHIQCIHINPHDCKWILSNSHKSLWIPMNPPHKPPVNSHKSPQISVNLCKSHEPWHLAYSVTWNKIRYLMKEWFYLYFLVRHYAYWNY